MSGRMLYVDVVQAKNIIGVNKKSGTSDTYVSGVLEGIGGREIATEKFHTKVAAKTLQPQWNEKLTFGTTYDINPAGELPTLVLSLFHKGGYLMSDELMGKVTIPLDMIDPHGNVASGWYPLVGDARLKYQASGELFLKIKFSAPTAGAAAAEIDTGLGDGTTEGDEDPDFEEQNPNELTVVVIQAKGLEVMDKNLFGRGGSSDPFVKCRIEGFDTKKTKVMKKNLNPVWNDKLVWSHVEDASLSLEASVEDYNDVLASEFMARVIVPLADFADKRPVRKWYKLLGHEGENDGKDRGQIELQLHWTFNKALLTTKKAPSKMMSVSGLLQGTQNVLRGDFGGGSEEEEEDDGDEPAEPPAPPKEESAEEKEEKKKAEEERMKDLQDIEIKTGDYQVQVHIIECRDLKGENEDGTSDPVVYVECFKQKQNTTVKYSCTSCVFDELLIFDIKDVEKEEFEDAIIRIACYDSNTIGRNKMIGAWACDATMVYFQKDHEHYRKWIPLMDDEDADDVGVQGYMKMSISIIGPGEKMKVHDEDAEKREEMKREAASGGDVGSMVMEAPNVRKEWVYLVTHMYKAEALTVMDGAVKGLGVTVAKSGTDAFVGVSFGGAKEICTKVKTVKGQRAAMNPEFNYELWYPISVPSMTQLLKISVYDDDATGKELIGMCFQKYGVVDKSPGRTTPVQYINLYGAPEDKSGGLAKNALKAAKKAKAAAKSLGGEQDYKLLYNTVADKASTFKGKVMCRFSLKSQRPEKYDAKFGDEIKPFRRKVPRLPPKSMPPTQEYILQALVVSGSDLPGFVPLSVTAVGGKKQDLRVKVTIGHIELCTKPGTFNNGVVSWQEKLTSDPLKLPVDLEQIPDIIIYIVREDNSPVCFSRLKPYNVSDTKKKNLIGFYSSAKWFKFQEDKVLDCLDDGEFPGSVLVKLGFGLASEASSHDVTNHWAQSVQAMKSKEPHQVRVHIYQARDLAAADSNGLSDPYAKVSFMGLPAQKTEYKKETLFPCWYETKIFNVELPTLEYAPQVNFKIFDVDLTTVIGDGDYLGCCNFDLHNAQITSHDKVDSEELKDPMWIDLYKELPGDGSGQLLVSVQLIKKTSPAQVLPSLAKDAIVPASRPAFIEIIAVGCRDMAPYNFMAMQLPYLQFVLDIMGKKIKMNTTASKRPNPSNPNFLERMIMEVNLPEKAIFAAPLKIRAFDTRLGGYLKPEVGVGSILMAPKIPWWPFDLPLDDTPHPPTYRAPQTQVFVASAVDKGSGAAGLTSLDSITHAPATGGVEMLDATGKRVKELKEKRTEAKDADDFVSTLEAPNVDEFVNARMAKEETGAGVFGALRHINLKGVTKKKGAADAFTDPDWSQDDSDQPPAWSINRKTLAAELEEDFKTTPFETYPLTRGQENGLLGSTLKTVGKFKGLVRVMRNKDDEPMFPADIMADLFKPKLYKVRLYCLRGVSLAKMDVGITGKPESSDPYLLVKLGKHVINDRENAVDNATDVDFYKLMEMDAELPGTSQLSISVMDKDMIGSDDLIGKTTIDLEDRWFDGRWQEWGRENRVTEVGDAGQTRFDTKPVEVRTLYLPGKSSSQGALTCWVDIMKPEEASFFEPDDVALPPKQMFEMRLVIWKSKNVPPMDTLEGMSDLYIKAWPEGCDPQETDTHWRCKKGKASWNWRMLFDVELGHSTRAMKFPFLHVQLWDRDLLKWNDCAGEVHLNLEKYYRKAYKRNIAIKLFEKKKGAAAARAKKAAAKPPREVEDTNADIPRPETAAEAKAGSEAAAEAKKAAGAAASATAGKGPASPGGRTTASPLHPEYRGRVSTVADADSDDDDDDDAGVGAIPRKSVTDAAKASASATASATPESQGAAAKPWYSFSMPWGKKDGDEDKALLDEDEEDDEEKGAIDKEKEQDDQDMKDLITQIKGMTGLYEDDPEDSDWLHFEKHDHNNPGKPESMGYVAYSLQIWPKDKAVVMAVGSAQTEPNNNPYLPPPVGRLKFSWNPFVLGSELCGPKLCAYFTCCLICAAFITMMIFCQPFINIIINICFIVM